MNINFFDCNVRLGRANNPNDSKIYTAAQITEHMKFAGINNALVFHNEAIIDWRNGNDRLIHDMQKYKNLHGCGVLVPECTGETGNINVYLDYLIINGIRAIRLFPKLNNFSMQPWSVESLIKSAAKHKMPILIDYIDYKNSMLPYSTWEYSPDFDEIFELAITYPKADFIVIMPGMQTQRKQMALLANTDNVYLECSSFGYKDIEHVCIHFGFNRLLFGSYMPLLEPGTFRTYIMYADISDEEKAGIAGGNLQNLLSGVK